MMNREKCLCNSKGVAFTSSKFCQFKCAEALLPENELFFPQTFSVYLWNAGPSIWVLNQHLLFSFFKSQFHDWQRKRKSKYTEPVHQSLWAVSRLGLWCESEDAGMKEPPLAAVCASSARGWELALSKAYSCYFLVYSSRKGHWPIKPNDYRFSSLKTVSYRESTVMNLFFLSLLLFLTLEILFPYS